VTADVLVCAPSVRTQPQQATYDAWCESLRGRKFHIRALRREHYAKSPWHQLADLMRHVDGVVLLGFRQMEISAGLWRGGTSETAAVNTVWTSPWMQVEGGMAIASELPVLAVAERGVCEGIFAPENWTANVFGCAADDRASRAAAQWAVAVRRGIHHLGYTG
jgi:hypothetical protein